MTQLETVLMKISNTFKSNVIYASIIESWVRICRQTAEVKDTSFGPVLSLAKEERGRSRHNIKAGKKFPKALCVGTEKRISRKGLRDAASSGVRNGDAGARRDCAFIS